MSIDTSEAALRAEIILHEDRLTGALTTRPDTRTLLLLRQALTDRAELTALREYKAAHTECTSLHCPFEDEAKRLRESVQVDAVNSAELTRLAGELAAAQTSFDQVTGELVDMMAARDAAQAAVTAWRIDAEAHASRLAAAQARVNELEDEKVSRAKMLEQSYGSGKTWCCRFHPTDWWHEVGCPHRDWTDAELRSAGYGHLLEAARPTKERIEAVLREEAIKVLPTRNGTVYVNLASPEQRSELADALARGLETP
jgi:hypothetical protein